MQNKLEAESLKGSVLAMREDVTANTFVKSEDAGKYFEVIFVDLTAIPSCAYKSLDELPKDGFYIENAMTKTQMVMNDYKPTKTFLEMLSNKDFYNIIKELVDFGICRYERDYKQSYDVTDFVLYQKYTYEDVCRLLNWEQNEVPLNIGGYKYDKKTKTFPVFINYDKSDDISDTTKYEDHFEPGFRDRLIAISKSGRSLQSEDVQNFLKAKERGIRVELFVRKNKDDKISKEFYYLGHMTASGNTKEFTMPNTQKTAVEIEWILDVPVREDIYEYIVNS
jgi:hypothetical protein